jgi:DNA-binding LytR/AlgR family response regulator
MLPKKLFLECDSKIELIDTDKIKFISIDAYNTKIHFTDNTKSYSNRSLISFESSLRDNFIRINRNNIVNIFYIENIDKVTRMISVEKNILLLASYRQMKNLIKRLNLISIRSTKNK